MMINHRFHNHSLSLNHKELDDKMDLVNIYGIAMEYLWNILVKIYDMMTGWWLPYPTEKDENSSIGMMKVTLHGISKQ